MAFIILGASMAALALMILVVAILATGETRNGVYRSSLGRVGGRIGKQNTCNASNVEHVNISPFLSLHDLHFRDIRPASGMADRIRMLHHHVSFLLAELGCVQHR